MQLKRSIKKFLQDQWHFLFTGFSLFLINLFVFRSLLLNFTTHLFDWNDYGLYVWIFYQNIFHLRQFDFSHLFEGNIFYSHPHVMLFSDLFLPQSIMALPLSFVIHNPITVFNCIFFLTLFLNGLAAYFFWRNFTKDKLSLFFTTFATVFSAYTFQNWVHFQILSIWPFFLCLGWLIKKEYTVKRAIIGGLLISLLLHSSVYLWVFCLTLLGLWYLFQIPSFVKMKVIQRRSVLFFFGVLIGTMLLTSGFTIYSYWQTRQIYDAKRDYTEYVSFSAHLSDYLFPPHGSSLLWQTSIAHKWSQFNRHGGMFPGFVLSLIAVVGLFTYRKLKSGRSLQFNFNSISLFFFILIPLGFLFSLGPRLNFNGVFLELPLPYSVLLKINPFFEVVRVTYRWSLLLFLGLTYFAIKGIEKITFSKRRVVVIGLLLFMAAETIPLSYQTRGEPYEPAVYSILKQECASSPQVLMEYPLTQFMPGADVVSNLTYRTQMMMASIDSHCLLINGYSGYIPSAYEEYEHTLFVALENRDKKTFIHLLKQGNVQLFKLNKADLYPDRVQFLQNWLSHEDNFKLLYEDDHYMIVKVGT